MRARVFLKMQGRYRVGVGEGEGGGRGSRVGGGLLHIITLHFITLQYMTWNYTTLHIMTLHSCPFPSLFLCLFPFPFLTLCPFRLGRLETCWRGLHGCYKGVARGITIFVTPRKWCRRFASGALWSIFCSWPSPSSGNHEPRSWPLFCAREFIAYMLIFA